jgi:hypothetical protein
MQFWELPAQLLPAGRLRAASALLLRALLAAAALGDAFFGSQLRGLASVLSQLLLGRGEGEGAVLLKPLHDSIDAAVRAGIAQAEAVAGRDAAAGPPPDPAQVQLQPVHILQHPASFEH